MKLVIFSFLCLFSVSSSLGGTLAEYLTQGSSFPADIAANWGTEQENQAAPVAQLTVGNIKSNWEKSFTIGKNIPLEYEEYWAKDRTVLFNIFKPTDSAQSWIYSPFSICSLSMSVGSGHMINVQSFSFNYSQLSLGAGGPKSLLPPKWATPSLPVEFTLMAKINGGESISLQTISIAGGTDSDKWILGKEVIFDLSSAEIQAKIGGANSIEFDLQGKFGAGDSKTLDFAIGVDNVRIGGEVVPEPSSALLCMLGLLPLLRRKRNS